MEHGGCVGSHNPGWFVEDTTAVREVRVAVKHNRSRPARSGVLQQGGAQVEDSHVSCQL